MRVFVLQGDTPRLLALRKIECSLMCCQHVQQVSITMLTGTTKNVQNDIMSV